MKGVKQMIEDTRTEDHSGDYEYEWKAAYLNDKAKEALAVLLDKGSVETPCGVWSASHLLSEAINNNSDAALCVAAKDTQRLHILMSEQLEPHFDAESAYDYAHGERINCG